ncbi:MAG: hypothetical protein AAF629_10230 [Chloroflexota bacterium]
MNIRVARHLFMVVGLALAGLMLMVWQLSAPVSARETKPPEQDNTISSPRNHQQSNLVSITKSGPNAVPANDMVTYMLTVQNLSQRPLEEIVISDTVPAGTKYVSGGTVDNDIVYWNFPMLDDVEQRTVSFTVSVTETPFIVNDNYGVSGKTSNGTPFTVLGEQSIVTVLNEVVTVLDEFQQPIEGAYIYRNGDVLLGDDNLPKRTNHEGRIVVPNLSEGEKLVAFQMAYTQPTNKLKHTLIDSEGTDVAFRVYRTSMPIVMLPFFNVAMPQPYMVNNENGGHTLQIMPQNTLVLFNIVASIGWDADQDYIETVQQGLIEASNTLYNTTNGQMAFGSITIFENGDHWHDADIQIRVSNHVRPHAYIGGISPKRGPHKLVYKDVNPEAAHIILGRGWNRFGGGSSSWADPDGHRTIAHEFGHYGLFLFDEYFGLTTDEKGQFVDEFETACTQGATTTDGNASLMFWHYGRLELCSQVSHYPVVRPTRHTQIYGPDETSWVTIQGVYSDLLQLKHAPAVTPWEIVAPMDRGFEFIPGPTTVPLNIPTITRNDVDTGAFRSMVQVIYQDQPMAQVQVALHRRDGAILDQGLTDKDGFIDVWGAHAEDIIRVRLSASRQQYWLSDISLIGSASELKSSGHGIELAIADHAPMVTATNRPGGINYYFSNMGRLDNAYVHLFDSPNPPIQTQRLNCQDSHDSCQISFDYVADSVRQLTLWMTDTTRADIVSGDGFVELGNGHKPSYANFMPDGTGETGKTATFFSHDGNLRLTIFENDFAGPEPMPYILINNTNALPGPPPPGTQVVGLAYSIGLSGTLNTKARAASLPLPGALSLGYHTFIIEGLDNAPDGSPGIELAERVLPYMWDEQSNSWKQFPIDPAANRTQRDLDFREISIPIERTGTYVLMVEREAMTPTTTYLPGIQR